MRIAQRVPGRADGRSRKRARMRAARRLAPRHDRCDIRYDEVLVMRAVVTVAVAVAGLFAFAHKLTPLGTSPLPAVMVVPRERPNALVFVDAEGRHVSLPSPPPIPPSHETRTSPPDNEHVWLDGQLWWSGRGYVWMNGSWAIPPSNDARWEPGRWVSIDDRWQIVPGHWVVSSNPESVGPADPIAFGVTAIGTLRESYHDFAVRLRAGESVSAIATKEASRDDASPFEWDVQLFERGRPLARGEEGAGSGERELAWTASDDDVYVFRVIARGATREVPYRFVVSTSDRSP
jgi:hypothetical protein